MIDRVSSADAAILYNRALESDGKSPRFTEEDIQLFRNGADHMDILIRIGRIWLFKGMDLCISIM